MNLRTFQTLNNDRRDLLLAKTAAAAHDGLFEPFKTTSLFDGTALNPAWLGEERAPVRQLLDIP